MTDAQLPLNRDHARCLDQRDPLAPFRERFHVPPDSIYLCGNSLGLQPRSVAAAVEQELSDWQTLAVRAHFEGRNPWVAYHELLTEKTARLVGAQSAEVVNMNTLTVNLHLMMVSFFRPTPERFKILIERPAFPSDRYAVVSQLGHHGLDPAQALLEIGPRPGEAVIRDEDLAALIESEGPATALILLPGVQYYSGQVLDMERITRRGHEQGCVVGFDLAHATGNIPMELHDWGVDFACWCTYKYLNAGPGAVAGCFVHQRHLQRRDLQRFAGWWGHDKRSRFKMGPEFQPMPGAEGWQLSNPSILSMAPLLASLEIFDEAGMTALRSKSVALTGYLEMLLRGRLAGRVQILTPAEPQARGCQLSLRITGGGGREVFEALGARGVVCDWREPDVIRVAPVPLYNQFLEVHRFVELLDEVTA
jgi:kynureninase